MYDYLNNDIVLRFLNVRFCHPELDLGSRPSGTQRFVKESLMQCVEQCQRKTLNQAQGDVFGCSYRTVGGDSDCLVGGDSSLLKVLD